MSTALTPSTQSAASARAFGWAMLRFSKPATTALIVASVAINLLVLTSPIYMLQVYDRVLASYSLETLLFLTLLLLGLLGLMTAIEQLRSKLSLRIGTQLADALAAKVFDASVRERLRGGTRTRGLQDVEAVRQFVSSGALTIFLDLPLMPLFVIIAWLLSPVLGLLTLLAAALLAVLAVLSEVATRGIMRESTYHQARAAAFADSSLRNAQTIQAMAMRGALRARWNERNRRAVLLQVKGADRSAALSSLSRYVRIAVQSLVLGAGAYLVIRQKMTPGMMIAGAVLLGRGLAPIEQAVGGWRGLLAARDAYGRIQDLLRDQPPAGGSVTLPAPEGRLTVERATVTSQAGDRLLLKNVSFSLEPGQTLAILGPTGSGKSTLAKALVGALRLRDGLVRLDGAALADWPEEMLGRSIGYMPQEVELFDGTIADNIGRFQTLDSEAVVRAAKQAAVHELILKLPKGYDTGIGEAGVMLSGGQRQRIALARALYGDPAMIVLDEPNSNLDTEGEAALAEVLANLKARKATVVVVSHRILMGRMDIALVLNDGAVQAYGPMQEVLASLQRGRNSGQGALAATRPTA
jgi:PrtD family type I secretion system ABC transporter